MKNKKKLLATSAIIAAMSVTSLSATSAFAEPTTTPTPANSSVATSNASQSAVAMPVLHNVYIGAKSVTVVPAKNQKFLENDTISVTVNTTDPVTHKVTATEAKAGSVVLTVKALVKGDHVKVSNIGSAAGSKLVKGAEVEVKYLNADDEALGVAKDKANAAIDKAALDADKAKAAHEAVNNATTPDAVAKALKDAGVKMTDTAPAADTSPKGKAHAVVASLTHLSKEAKADFDKKIDAASDDAAAKKVAQDAVAADLVAYRTDATNTINNLTLTKEQKADFAKKVSEAKDAAGVSAALKAAEDKANGTDLTKAKADAKAAVAKLTLTDDEKTKANTSIDGAKTVQDIDKIVKDATAQSDKELGAALAPVKADAKAAVAKLTLTDAQKAEVNKNIDAATTKEAVAQLLKSAQDASAKADAKKPAEVAPPAKKASDSLPMTGVGGFGLFTALSGGFAGIGAFLRRKK